MRTDRTILVLALSLLFPFLANADSLPATGSRDAQMLAQGQEKLARLKTGDRIQLKVDNAAATLSGTVDSIAVKERASREILKVPGIVTVVNNLNVASAVGGDDQLLQNVAHEIRLYPYYNIFDNIEASSDGGRVKLTGQVVEPWHKTDIGRIVAATAGVKSVDNNLEVLPFSPYDNELRIRIARAIYGDPLFARYAIQALPPIHIIVKNGNVTLVGNVHDAVEKAEAFRAARFAATYFDLNNQLQVETAQVKTK